MLITHNKTRGITLVELMIALAISSTLLLGVGSVYFNSKRTYLVQEEFAHLQESARVAMRLMVEDIRAAGYIGCAWNADPNQYENYLDDTDPVAHEFMGNFLVGMEGMEATTSGPGDPVNLAGPPAAGWDRALPGFITNAPLDGSDVMIVRHAAGNGFALSVNNDDTNFWLDDRGDPNISNVTGNNCHDATNICEGDIILATDCQKSRLFQVTDGIASTPQGIMLTHNDGTGAGIQPGNREPIWGNGTGIYPEFEVGETHIYTAVSYAYYIANNVGGVPSLFRQLLRPGSNPEEIIEGAENMQILYGVDTDKTAPDADITTYDGVANRYVTADQVNVANDNVVSARVSLLLRTNNEVVSKSGAAPAAKNYTLAGMTAATGTVVTSPADRRLRKIFTTTVKIRSKGLQ